MYVEIGTEAAQFPEKEYINGISFAVCRPKKSPKNYHYLALCVLADGSYRVGGCHTIKWWNLFAFSIWLGAKEIRTDKLYHKTV